MRDDEYEAGAAWRQGQPNSVDCAAARQVDLRRGFKLIAAWRDTGDRVWWLQPLQPLRQDLAQTLLCQLVDQRIEQRCANAAGYIW